MFRAVLFFTLLLSNLRHEVLHLFDGFLLHLPWGVGVGSVKPASQFPSAFIRNDGVPGRRSELLVALLALFFLFGK